MNLKYKNKLKNLLNDYQSKLNNNDTEGLENPYTDDDYVYLLSFNQGIIPTIHKDESYLSDKDKQELNISLTVTSLLAKR